MTTTTEDRLQHLRDALERATTRDLAATQRTRSNRRRTLAALAVAAVIVPGGAYAGSRLLTESEVAAGLPRGTHFLVGTSPTCRAVRDQVEYDCTTSTVPAGEIAPGQFMGTVEPTVGADQRVNGGCRAVSADGTRWRCFIGEEAVRQSIISSGFLGQLSEGPGRG